MHGICETTHLSIKASNLMWNWFVLAQVKQLKVNGYLNDLNLNLFFIYSEVKHTFNKQSRLLFQKKLTAI